MWAYGWNPSVCGPNDFCVRIEKGQIALDPAWYIWERHQRSGRPNAFELYDPATGTGVGLSYCFNGYLAVYNRGIDPKCPTQ